MNKILFLIMRIVLLIVTGASVAASGETITDSAGVVGSVAVSVSHFGIILIIGLISIGWYYYKYYLSNNDINKSTAPPIRYTTTRGNIPFVLYHLPQGYSWPLFGQLYNFLMKRPWDLLMEWHILYGPIVTFTLLNENMISIAYSPVLLRAILQSQISSVKKDVTNTMKPFLSILGTGIVSSEGTEWLKQRLKMSHPLRFDVLERIPMQTLYAVQRLMETMDGDDTSNDPYNDNNCETKPKPKPKPTEQTMKERKGRTDCGGGGVIIPLGSSLRHLTLQVISSTFLSLSANESDTTFATLYLPIVEESNQRIWHPYRTYLPILPSWWMYHINVYRLNAYISNLIKKRWTVRQQEKKQQNKQLINGADTVSTTHSCTGREYDILDQVLLDCEKQIQKQKQNQNQVPSTNDNDDNTILPSYMIQQIRDEMKTFMLAGHETSAAMMTWAFYELMRLQRKQRKQNAKENLPTQVVQTASTSPLLLSVPDLLLKEANNMFDPDIDWKVAMSTSSSSSVLPNKNDLVNGLLLSEALLKESLRKYSVVPVVARRTVQDLTIRTTPTTANAVSNTPSISNEKVYKDDYIVLTDDDDNENKKNNYNNNDRSTQDVHLNGSSSSLPLSYFIPKGSSVFINIQACHHNPKYWPNPKVYDPFRFLEANTTTESALSTNSTTILNNSNRTAPTNTYRFKPLEPFSFIPFIAGPRNCLGQHLALLESKIVIALLWQRYHFDFVVSSSSSLSNFTTSEDEDDNDDPRHRFMVPVIPNEEIYVQVSKRRNI